MVECGVVEYYDVFDVFVEVIVVEQVVIVVDELVIELCIVYDFCDQGLVVCMCEFFGIWFGVGIGDYDCVWFVCEYLWFVGDVVGWFVWYDCDGWQFFGEWFL